MGYEEVGAGWIKTTKKGTRYISIKLKANLDSGEFLSLWKNEEKRTDKSPDYRLTVNSDKPKTQREESPTNDPDDDIPF